MAQNDKSKLEKLYDGLVERKMTGKSYDDFKKEMETPGDEGYRNRYNLWKELRDSGATAKSYDDFRDGLGFHRVAQPAQTTQPTANPTGQEQSQTAQTTQPTANPAEQPTANSAGQKNANPAGQKLSERQRQEGIAGLQNIIDQSRATVQGTQQGMQSRLDYTKRGGTGQVLSGGLAYNPEKGKVEREYLTPDGGKTTNKAEAETSASQTRVARNITKGMESGDYTAFDDFVGQLFEGEYADAEERSKEQLRQDMNVAKYGHAQGTGVAQSSIIQSYASEHDIEKAIENVAKGIPTETWRRVADKAETDLLVRKPEATPEERQKAREDAVSELSNHLSGVIWDRSSDKLRKMMGSPNFISSMIASTSYGVVAQGLASQGGSGWSPYLSSLQEWNEKHGFQSLMAGIAGMSIDPVTYLSAGVGGLASKGAMYAAGRQMVGRAVSRDVATRVAQNSIKARFAAGVAAGSANFGTFETLHGVAGQMGEGRFDVGELAGKTAKGVVLGGAMGAFGGMWGNVTNNVASKVGSTAGKVATKAGMAVPGVLGEAGIFWAGDVATGEDPQEAWDGAIKMILGFKVMHGVKAAPRLIAGGVEHQMHRADMSRSEQLRDKGFFGNMAERIAATPEVGLTEDEMRELREYEYTDIADLCHKATRATETGELTERERDGESVFESETEENEYYDNLARLMQDKRVSASARMKMAYIVTGRQLPSPTITGVRVNRDDATGKTTVESMDVNGETITRRTYKSEKEAARAADKVRAQAELNSVDIGEKSAEARVDARQKMDAIQRVAQETGYTANGISDIVRMAEENPDKATPEQMEAYRMYEEALRANEGQFAIERPEAIRAELNETYGVDIDKAIKKSESDRTSQEKDAIAEYGERLYPENARERSASADPNQRLLEHFGNIYDDGYDIDDSDERASATQDYNIAREAARQRLGAEWIARADDSPLEALQELYGAKDRAIALDYINAKATWDGVTQRVKDEAQDKAATVGMTVSLRTHLDGRVHEAELKELADERIPGVRRKVYIVGGNVVPLADGTGIDHMRSDKTLIVVDETGKKRFIDVSDLHSVSEPVDAQEMRDMVTAEIEQDEAQKAADELNGTFEPMVGALTTIHLDGRDVGVTIAGQHVDNDGQPVADRWDVDYIGKDGQERRAVMTTEEIQQCRDAYIQSQAQSRADARTQSRAQAEAANRQYSRGDTFALVKDGEEYRGEVLGESDEEVDADGRKKVMLYLPDAPIDSSQVVTLGRKELEEYLTEYNGEAVERAENSGTETGAETYTPKAGDTFTVDDDGVERIVTVEGPTVGDKRHPVSGLWDISYTDGEGKKHRGIVSTEWIRHNAETQSREPAKPTESTQTTSTKRTQTPVAEEVKVEENKPTTTEPRTAMERIEKDDDGNPLFEKAETGLAWDALVEMAEGNTDLARRTAEGMVRNAEEAVKKAEKSKAAGGTNPMQIMRAEKQRDDAIAQARATLAHWQEIALEDERRQREKAIEEANAAADKARLEDAERERRRAQEQARREAEDEQARIEREQLQGVPDVTQDKPEDARKRGYRSVNGVKVVRQEPVEHVEGRESSIKFSDKETAKGNIAVIEADQLQPSHKGGLRNTAFFIDEAQPKDRTDEVSKMSADKIAANINPEEITGDGSAYQFSAPTTNTRGEVIQGNNRSEALRQMWEGNYPDSQARYRQYLIDHAEELGLDADAVGAMRHPVMVNMVDVDDAEAIHLGQFTATDIESGGVERINAVPTARKLGEKMSNFANVLLKSEDEDASLSDLMVANGAEAVKWLEARKAISPTQALSAFDKKGNLTAEAKMDLQNILKTALFQGGVSDLPTMFAGIPAKAQKAILTTFMRDFDSEEAQRILPELQEAIAVCYFARTSTPLFASAGNYNDARIAIEGYKRQFDMLSGGLPTDLYSNFAFELAARMQGCSMRSIQQGLSDLFDFVQGVGSGDLFGGSKAGEKLDLAEAIKRVYDIDYKPIKKGSDGKERGDIMAVDAGTGAGWRRGEPGDDIGGGRDTQGERTAEPGGGTGGDSGEERDASSGERGLQGGGETGVRQAHEDAGAVSLSERDASELMSRMEDNAPEIPRLELNPENWARQFGENGMVPTPIGNVKMGANQIAKLFEKDRAKQFGMIKPTLETPQAIIEVPSSSVDGEDERGTSLLFVKTFTGDDGKKIYYFKSVTVKKDGLEVSVSSHYDRAKRIKEALMKGKLLYRFDGGAQTEHRPAGVSVAASPVEEQGEGTRVSSADKDTEKSLSTQGNEEKKDVVTQIAAAEAETDTDPTEAQKKAGNYKKGHVKVDGHDVTIENPKGSVRSGEDADGKKWSVTMGNTYGYIRGTEGVDGDHIDVFLSDKPEEGDVWVVDQVDPKTGAFDEHKVMYGFTSEDEARKAYLSSYSPLWKGLGAITHVSKDEFKKWIQSSHRKTKPFAEYKSVRPAEDAVESKENGAGTKVAEKPVREWKNEDDREAVSRDVEEATSVKPAKVRLINYADKDPKHLVLTGVYHDGEEKVAVSSDGHVLVYDKRAYDAGKKGEIVDKNGDVVTSKKYPAWKGLYDAQRSKMSRVTEGGVPMLRKKLATIEEQERKDWIEAKERDETKDSFAKYLEDVLVWVQHPDGDGEPFVYTTLRKFADAAESVGAKDFLSARTQNPEDEESRTPAIVAEGKHGGALAMTAITLPRHCAYTIQAKGKSQADAKREQAKVEKPAQLPGEDLFDYMERVSKWEEDRRAKETQGPQLDADTKERGAMSREQRVAYDAVREMLGNSGVEVTELSEDAMNALADMSGGELSRGKKRAPETDSIPQEELQHTAIPSADGAKILKNLDTLAKSYDEKEKNHPRTFVGEVADALGVEASGKSSKYRTFETKNGQTVVIRLSNHNARVSNFDNAGEEEGISIVISPKKSKGITNDGEAHVVEFYYDAIKLRRAESKPLSEIVRSIRQALMSGEYKDTTGLAVRQEVNGAEAAQLMTVYHGSGADFDEFDHSHMGEGEGAQAYGWGSYVTEVEGIGRTYAKTNAMNTYDRYMFENRKAYAQQRLKLYPTVEDFLKAEEIRDAMRRFNHDEAYIRRYYEERIKKVAATNWPAFLYSVEIPDDTGENYFPWDDRADRLTDRLGITDEEYEAEDMASGRDVYEYLARKLGSDKAASEYLAKRGFVGIKYPANYMSGGRPDNAKNYVIFNEKDLKIKDKVQFMQDKDRVVYGATVGGKIYLNGERLNPESPIHEYTHIWDNACKAKNPELWKRGVELLKQTPLWEQVRNDENYADIKNDEDRVASEVHSRLTGKDGAALLEEMANGNTPKGVIEKLKQWLKDFWWWCKDTFSPWTKEEAERVSLDDFVNMPLKDLAQGRDLHGNGMTAEESRIVEDAKRNGTYMKAPNGKDTRLTEKQWAQVRTKAFKDWFGDWEKPARIEKLRRSEPVVVSGEEYKGKYELNRDSAKSWIMESLRGKTFSIKDTGEEVTITRVGANKVTSHSAGNEAHLKSIASIPQLIENAIFVDEFPNEKGNDKYDNYRYYVCGLKMGGVDYTAKITIGVKQGKKYYDHSLTEIEKGKLLDLLSGETLKTDQEAKGFTTTGDAPEPSSALSDYKDKRLISLLQGNSSKVVDENGEPLVVYHGTDADFTVFDPSKGRASMDIQGMFFSPWSEDAGGYGGNVRPFFLNLRNPADESRGYEALKKFQGQNEAGIKARESLAHDGFDGVDNSGEEYIAFDPAQAKSATDNVGTFDAENDDIRFFIGKKAREQYEATLRKRNVPEEWIKESLDYLHSLEDTKDNNKKIKVAVKWLGDGTIRLPEDIEKVNQALDVATKAKVDPMQYKSPMELLEAHANFKLTRKRIDPDTVSTLKNKKEYDDGIVVYDVEESEESRKNMREIINTHFGEDASPWCLLQGDGEGKLTSDSRQYWNHYNAYPKRVAFQNGKLLAFCANDSEEIAWWDRQDSPHDGIPVTRKMPNDELGRTATYEYIVDEKTGGYYGNPTDIHRGNKLNGLYEQWDENGTLWARINYKDGKKDGLCEKWHDNGKPWVRSHYKDEKLNGLYEQWDENGTLRERFNYKDEKLNGLYEQWDENGTLRERFNYKDGKKDGLYEAWDKNGTLREHINYKDGKQNGLYEEWDENGTLREHNFYINDRQVSEEEWLRHASEEENVEDGVLYRAMHEGAGALSDAEVSKESDPWAKMGMRRTEAEKAEYARRERRRMREKVEEMSKKFGVDIEIMEDGGSLRDGTRMGDRKARAKGFYSKRDGKITVILGNHASVGDIEKTILHEAVAHKGLRQLFGKHFNDFLDNVYQHATEEIRRSIASLAGKRGWDFRTATEEYLAKLAEDTDFEIENKGFKGWWTKVKQLFLDMLHKIGLRNYNGPELTDNELRYVLWRSYENLGEPGRYRSITGEAKDIAKQEQLGVYEERFAPEERKPLEVADSERRERRDETNRAIDRAVSLVTGRPEAEVRHKRKEREQERRKEAREIYENVLNNNFDDVTLRAIDKYIEDATPKNPFGRRISERVPQEVERSLHAGERTCAVDALFSRISESAVPASERRMASGRSAIEAKKKELLEGWAKATGRWHTDVKDFTDGEPPFDSGKDSDVYHSKDGKSVIKVSKGKNEGKRFSPDLDAVALFNYVFPNTAYKILGYGEVGGRFVKFLEQSRVEFAEPATVSVEERTDYMRSLGFEPLNKENTVFSNGKIVVSDLQKGNIVRDKNGNIRVIDADVRLHTRDIGGEHAYPEVEADTRGVEEDILLRDGDGKSLAERIDEERIRLASENKGNVLLRDNAMRAISSRLGELRRAMSKQRHYDKQTVKQLTGLVQSLIENGMLTDMRGGEVKRLLSAVKNGATKDDISGDVQKIFDITIDNHLRAGEAMLNSLIHIKGSKVDARGVEVQGQLDVQGQRMVKAFREVMGWSLENIEERMSDIEERMLSDNKTVASEAETEYTALTIARQYAQDIAGSKVSEAELRKGLKDAKEDKDAGTMPAEVYKQCKESMEDAIRQNKIERAEAYSRVASMLAGTLSESVENAKAWREAEKARIEEIHHNATSDMQGRPAEAHRKDTRIQRAMNSSVARFFLQPLCTFDQMLRMFGNKSVDGEGYLYDRFGRGYIQCAQREWEGTQAAYETLDRKAAEIFGKKKMRWSDLYKIERRLPKVDVEVWDDGAMRPKTLTQGNLLYIYMVDKMWDGRMKLRHMGITEEKVAQITELLDPRFKALGDWLQDEFLVQLRNKYNEVHERMFGAPMAAIEDYFPLKTLANARQRDVDVSNVFAGDAPLASTITGAIIKRTVNTVALDVTNADAIDVILEHIQQMEHWAAFAEFTRDINTLLSYKHFRNQVQNMSSIYGGGEKLFEQFKDVCSMVTGAYRPSKVDEAIVNLAKGVTRAKISFRLFTATKQLLSLPVFVADAPIWRIAKNLANPVGAWNWAIKELPLFEKRWKSRQMGDTRLQDTGSDWSFWKNKTVDAASRYGMATNVFIDAVTIAVGARSVYEDRVAQYKREGFTDEVADRKAKEDAAVVYNQSQQSSEDMFISTKQKERTWASVAVTVFRNASMGFQRQYVDSIRNLKRLFFDKGYKAESVAFEAKKLVREGLTEDQAMKAAKARYNKAYAHNIVKGWTFGFLAQFCWNMGAKLPYILFGQDDEKKKEMALKAAEGAFVGGPVEGLAGGDILSTGIQALVRGESISDIDLTPMPIISDAEMVLRHLQSDKVQGINDIVNLVAQTYWGVNPQTFTDIAIAVIDACNGDMGMAHEAMLAAMRIMNVPQEQLDEIMIDELDMSAREAQKLTPGELAERYARYRVMRGAPLTGWWAYDEEGRKTAEDKQRKRITGKIKERLAGAGDEAVNAFYDEGEELSKGKGKRMDARIKEIAQSNKSPLDKAEEISGIVRSPEWERYMRHKAVRTVVDHWLDAYLKAETPEQAVEALEKMREMKQKYYDWYKEQ